ncbi:LamG-like jellyroll fold domain-containing protein [Candidatus Nanosalina sp. VS9-1]|uniref:LamG domain-containing protein n=1 Tax=Candidatus Nanosalina sp. VS9-1 TaxID=3388566 RepID=UPI0039E12922
MAIRWDSESDWKNNQDSSGTTGRNGDLRQGYSRDRPPLSSGLIGYWPLNDDNATDYSGNENHGSLNGGVTTGVAGKGGLQAMSFDGSDDYVDVSGAENSSFPVTISAWVKADGTGRIYSESTSSNGDNILALDIGGDPATAILYLRGQQNTPVTSKSNTEVIGEWHHIVGVATANELRIYVNGELENTQLHSRPFPNVSNAQIGRLLYSSGSISHLDGVIAQCSTYNRALSNSEIQTLYKWGSGDYARPPNNGVSYYKLDGDATDSWGANDGTTNSVTFTNDAIRGQAAKFNGSSSIGLSNLTGAGQDYTVALWLSTDVSPTNNFENVMYASGHTFDHDDLLINGKTAGSFDGGQPGVNIGANDGNWHHVTVVNDSGTHKVFKNSLYAGSWTNSLSSNNGVRDSIGARYDDSDNSYDAYGTGKVDDVRVFDRTLSRREIFQIYHYGTRGRDMRKHLVNH